MSSLRKPVHNHQSEFCGDLEHQRAIITKAGGFGSPEFARTRFRLDYCPAGLIAQDTFTVI
jgi:hypothetical protein